MTTPRLVRRYSVRGRTQERDDLGVRAVAYTHKFYLWGEEPRDGGTGAFRDVGVLRTEDTFRLRTRYVGGLEVGDQLVSGTLTLYLRSALDLDGTRRWLQLVVSQSPSQGT